MVQIGYTMWLPSQVLGVGTLLPFLQLATLFHQCLVQSIINVYLSIIWLSKPLAISG